MLLFYIADVNSIGDERDAFRFLSEYSKNKINRRKTENGRKEALTAELLRARLLGAVGAENESVSNGEHGKPCLPDRPDLKYNMSHSGGLAAGILITDAQDYEIGVDIERVRSEGRETRIPRIMRRAFTEKEKAAVSAADDPMLEFYLIWSRKESYIKYTGEGLSRSLTSVDTTEKQDGVTIRTFVVTDGNGERYALSAAVPDEFAHAVKAPQRLESPIL